MPPADKTSAVFTTLILAAIGQVQDFVQRTLPVAFQIEGYVLEAQRLKNSREPAGHLRGSKHAASSSARDFQPHELAVKAHAELAESQCLHFLFAALDGFDVLDRHRRAVGDARS